MVQERCRKKKGFSFYDREMHGRKEGLSSKTGEREGGPLMQTTPTFLYS